MTRGRLQLTELFGLPGAGKSRLVREAARLSGIRTREDLSSAWTDQPALWKGWHVACALADVRSQASLANLVVRERIASPEPLKRTARLLAKSAWLRHQRGGLLLDQGSLQELWSILYSAGRMAPDVAALTPVIRRIYAGTEPTLVVIDVPPRVAAERVARRTRGDSRLDGLEVEEILERLERSSKIPEAIVCAARMAGLSVHHVDGSAPVEAKVARITGLLSPGQPCAESPAQPQPQAACETAL